jgi:hypothetical protein
MAIETLALIRRQFYGALALIVATVPASSWEAKNGNWRYFVNGTIDLNMRVQPGIPNAVIVDMPPGTRMVASKCENFLGLQDTWCYVRAGSNVGWVDAAYLQEIDRATYLAPPSQRLMAFADERAQVEQSSPPPPPATYQVAPPPPPAPTLYQQALPSCSDPAAIRTAERLFLQHLSHYADYFLTAEVHALGVNNMDAGKTCEVTLRADVDKARRDEAWIVSGSRPITELAAAVNHDYDIGKPFRLKFTIRPNGEGGTVITPIR